mgnify:CR=1 FL=1
MEMPSLNDLMKVPLSVYTKDELTDQEKFALCYAAGVEVVITPSLDGMTLTWTTKQKAAVVKIDGQWSVVIEPHGKK